MNAQLFAARPQPRVQHAAAVGAPHTLPRGSAQQPSMPAAPLTASAQAHILLPARQQPAPNRLSSSSCGAPRFHIRCQQHSQASRPRLGLRRSQRPPCRLPRSCSACSSLLLTARTGRRTGWPRAGSGPWSPASGPGPGCPSCTARCGGTPPTARAAGEEGVWGRKEFGEEEGDTG